MVCLREVGRGGRGGHQRHRNLANLVLISGPQTAFLHHFFVFCRTNSFLPNRTLCLLDGMRWGWNLKLACLRTLLQGFYQTFCWFWLELWLVLLLHLTCFQSHTDFGVWHNKLSELRPSFVSPIQFMLIFPQLIQNISDSAYIIYVQYWFVYFLCILLVWYQFVCFRCTALVQCTNSFTFCSSIYYQKVFVFVASKKRNHFVFISLSTKFETSLNTRNWSFIRTFGDANSKPKDWNERPQITLFFWLDVKKLEQLEL